MLASHLKLQQLCSLVRQSHLAQLVLKPLLTIPTLAWSIHSLIHFWNMNICMDSVTHKSCDHVINFRFKCLSPYCGISFASFKDHFDTFHRCPEQGKREFWGICRWPTHQIYKTSVILFMVLGSCYFNQKKAWKWFSLSTGLVRPTICHSIHLQKNSSKAEVGRVKKLPPAGASAPVNT